MSRALRLGRPRGSYGEISREILGVFEGRRDVSYSSRALAEHIQAPVERVSLAVRNLKQAGALEPREREPRDGRGPVQTVGLAAEPPVPMVLSFWDEC